VRTATGAGVKIGNTGVVVHWCRRARRRPARLQAKHVDAAKGSDLQSKTDSDDDDDALAHIDDLCDTHEHTMDTSHRGVHVKRLETHVWHAKRFEMRTRWGFAVPERRPGRGRGYRSTSKWTRDACAVHDGSYNACLRLEAALGSDEETSIEAVLARCVEGGARGVKVDDGAFDAVIMGKGGEPIAPAQVISIERGVSALVWVHPDAVDAVSDVLGGACGGAVRVTRVHSLCRLEITGETASASLSAVADTFSFSESKRVHRCGTRGDPREAAWFAKKRGAFTGTPPVDGSGQTPMEYVVRPATAQELGARRRAARRISGDFYKEGAPDANSVPVLPGCPLIVVRRPRGPLATSRDHGFTIIAPRGWAQPLLLSLVHLGARAAGRLEWGWLATAAGSARFPEDFPDTDAGRRWQGGIEDENRTRASVVPRGKLVTRPSVDLANLVVRRCSSSRGAPKKSKKSGQNSKKPSGSKWRPVGAGFPKSADTLVRCVVRCPWGGRPVAGATVLDPTPEQESAWRSGSGARRNRRLGLDELSHNEWIGAVTSASPAAASTGTASALVSVAALQRVRSRGYSPGGGGGTGKKAFDTKKAFVFLTVPEHDGSDGPAVVPAELTPALEASPDGVDATWW
jgi:ribonuclease P/MRP protein subunit POP1